MGGRIPEVEQTVSPTGPRVTGPTLGQEADVSAGLNAAGRVLGQAAGLAAKFEAEADAVRVTEALVDFERRSNVRMLGKDLEPIDAAFEGAPRQAGFLESRGTTAGQSSREVTDGLESDVQDIANKLLPRQRDAFLQRARQLQVSTERRITEHVVKEAERAKVDVLKAAQSETIRALGEDPTSGAWAIKSHMVEESMRALASSPEAADAAVADWKGRVAVKQITTLVEQGRTGEAEQRFAETRDVLGENTEEMAALLKRARAGDDKTRLNQEATAEVTKWLKEATPAGGYVDPAKVLERLQTSKPDDPRREALELEVRQQLQVEDARRKADVKRQQDVALRADLDGQQVPGSTYTFLREFDPDFLRGLKNDRETRWRRWKADNEGTAADKAAARRKQAEDDEFFNLKYASLSPEEQARTSPQEFAKRLAAENPDFSPSRNGYAKAEKHQADTRSKDGKAELADEKRFIAEAEKETMAQITTRGKVDSRFTKDGDPRTLISGRASQFYRSKRAALGRDPTPDEEQAWLGELKMQTVYESRALGSDKKGPAVLAPGFLPGSFGAPLPAAPPARAPAGDTPRPVRQLRRKLPDGTVETKTLFSDGSVR